MTRDEINNIGRLLGSIRMPNETDVIIGFGLHGPSQDCRNGHVSVMLRRGTDEATSEAVALDDALCLARGKLKAMAEKRERDREEAKAKKVAA